MTVASGSVGIRLFSRVQMDQTASSVRAAAETHKAVQGCWPRQPFPDPTTSCGQAFWSEEDVGVHFSIRWSDSQAGRYRSKYQRHLLPAKPFGSWAQTLNPVALQRPLVLLLRWQTQL